MNEEYVVYSKDDVRHMISAGEYDKADSILNGTPEESRDAEWHFLKGSVAYGRGFLNDAYTFFSTAAGKDPGNAEYKKAFENVSSRRNGYMNNPNRHGQDYNRTQMGSNGGCSPCQACQCLVCSDCCCECMGGDLISCC